MGYSLYLMAWNNTFEKMETVFLKTVPKDAMEQINYTANEKCITWIKAGEEFMLNNEQYDVIQKKTIEGNVYFYCIKEKDELCLMENVAEILSFKKSCDFNFTNPDLLTEYIPIQSEMIRLNIIPTTTAISLINTALPLQARNIILPPP